MMTKKENTEKDGIKNNSSVAGETVMDSSPDAAIFDRDGLLYRLMGDAELVEEIVDDFLNQIPLNVEALKQSLDKKDALQVKKEAHIIKGSAGNVGALALEELATKIETAGESEDLVKAELYFTEFDAQLKVFKNEMDRLFR